MSIGFNRAIVKFCGVIPEGAGDAVKSLVRSDIDWNALKGNMKNYVFKAAEYMPPTIGVPLAASVTGVKMAKDVVGHLKDGMNIKEATLLATNNPKLINQMVYSMAQSGMPMGDVTGGMTLEKMVSAEISGIPSLPIKSTKPKQQR